jgi:predicted 2-oxoglutarate/Fe(II)-dependent dioxygenase YbiX/peroxiredoxin
MAERLLPGDPAPWFTARTTTNPHYWFQSVAGRYVVLCFFGSAAQPDAAKALAAVAARRHLLTGESVAFFGVSVDPDDAAPGRVREFLPGIRCFWDFDRAVSILYGAAAKDEGGAGEYRPHWLVLDPMLRVMWAAPLAATERVLDLVATLPPVDAHAGMALTAPVLMLPRVFEPELCRRLIALYDQHGGTDSFFMREMGGRTHGVMDRDIKRRQDHTIEDPAIRAETRVRIARRIIPEIGKAFAFRATRIERFIVACYDATTGGFFSPHRDNTTTGTAHRRFAITINLNAEDYEGGDLRFPEFGSRTYRAPTGGAVVFGCSLLHEATKVTKGRRYAFLPFLYDEEGAKIREANAHSIVHPDRIETP